MSDLPNGSRSPHDGPGSGPVGVRPRSRVASTLFPARTDPAPPSAPRILVVDDNEGFRESLIALLVSEGMDVVGEASSGREALDMAARLRPDLVLMDVRMPYMDGVETTRRLKSEDPRIRIVALTAQEDESTVRDMLVAGASGYVTKNSDGEDILSAIAETGAGGAVLSPTVTPAVIDQLTEALDRERRHSQELEEAHLALIERVSRRHELVARLGHELRTPVTVILGLARTLASRELPRAERADLLERLVARATSLGGLVERFESAIDVEAGEPVDVAALVDAVGTERPRLRVAASGPGIPPAWGSAMLARRVLEEIVDNACRFSPETQPVEISLDSDDDQVMVRISDHGPGIDSVDRDRIFEPLEQCEALDSRTHQGVGIGLSVARAAARAMDGDIVLERTGPDGSTFLWTLPIDES